MDTSETSSVYLFGSFRFDRRGGGLRRCNESGDQVPVNLGSRALDLLGVLVERPGELVARHEIMAAVWPSVVVEEANLNVQISALRRILDTEGSSSSCIQTVPGRGYRFTLPVTQLPCSAASLQEPIPIAQPPPSLEVMGQQMFAVSPNLRRFKVALLAVAGLAVAGGIAGWHWANSWHRGPVRPSLSIVVLPFANLDSDPEQAYLAEAITDDLTTDLSRISGSVVIAHSTAVSYGGKAVDVRQVSRDLDVSYVLEGSVRPIGDQIEVNAQLIDGKAAAQVWAERFATDRHNLAEAQTQITGRLAQALGLQLIQVTSRRIEQEKNLNPDAADLVMRGWDLWYRPFSVATWQEAATTFDKALSIDPGSIDAKIGAATVLVSRVGIGMSQAPRQDMSRAEQLLTEVNEQDPQNTNAREVLGRLRRIQNRLDEARIEYETAVEADRNNAHAWLGLGQTLMFLGRPGDALGPIEKATRLDPRSPNLAFGDWSLGTCHLLLGHADLAADLLRKARTKDPRVWFFPIYLAAALGLQGYITEAQAALARMSQTKAAGSSLAAWRAAQPWLDNPAFITMSANTLTLGLHRAGMPDR